jgi:hypothetical protein
MAQTRPRQMQEPEQSNLEDLHCLRADQAAMAAFFSACFLVFAASPGNTMPATSTSHVKTGKCPGPERTVVYTGSDTPALCAVSCNKFLHTPVSSCVLLSQH